MFSPTKIFWLILILTFIWFLFRAIEKLKRKFADDFNKKKNENTIELIQCGICNKYYDKNKKHKCNV